MKILWFFLASIIVSTCSMAWVTDWQSNPPADTSRYYYAVGYGKTIKDAKSDALSTISAKISVSVASNFSNTSQTNMQNGDEEVIQSAKNEVQTQTKEIKYSDVKLVESFNDKKQWIVLVEVDRVILANSYQRELDKLDDKITLEWSLFESSEFMKKLKYSVSIDDYIAQTDDVFSVLYALNPAYDDTKYKTKYKNYTKAMQEAQDELVFFIDADENSASLKSLVKSELSKQKAVFNDDSYTVLIQIKTKAKEKRYKSTNAEFAKQVIALRTTTINSFDRDMNELSNVVYKTKSGSSDGFEDAILRTQKYQEMIDKNGIISFIIGN